MRACVEKVKTMFWPGCHAKLTRVRTSRYAFQRYLEMIAGIETRLFEREDGKVKMPKYSTNDLDNDLFRAAGEIFAVSLAQGGPAPRFLQEWCYRFMVSGNLEGLTKNCVHDPELSPFIKLIEEAKDLSPYTEGILTSGYTGSIKMENKDNIISLVWYCIISYTRAIQLAAPGPGPAPEGF
ncbi:hypothetical protein DPEC_G00199770 [Dallia pectoralis]|uniref:Uncharacterized protein n=1 Tax=Dallia pectoralis TaxID=75939 RepID=A0ACC2G8N3_DALPE|nr:hypothetical protein DPEC_G00199770 [Dallia pectoralis]